MDCGLVASRWRRNNRVSVAGDGNGSTVETVPVVATPSTVLGGEPRNVQQRGGGEENRPGW